MTHRAITLNVPEYLYHALQSAAAAHDHSLERVILDSLQTLFQPLPAYLELELLLTAMHEYTDAQLWAVVQRRTPRAASMRLRELRAQSERTRLPSPEQAELDDLIVRADRTLRMRAEALHLLTQRGHDPLNAPMPPAHAG